MQRLPTNNPGAAFPATVSIGFVAEPIVTRIFTMQVAGQIIESQPLVGCCVDEQFIPGVMVAFGV